MYGSQDAPAQEAHRSRNPDNDRQTFQRLARTMRLVPSRILRARNASALPPPAPPTALLCRTDTRTASAGKTLSTAYQPRVFAFKTREPHGQQQK